MRCRKNYRDLTNVERDRYVQALYHVKSTGVVDQLANEHETNFHHGIHGTSHFLPWHRDFVRRFEDALRTYHPAVTIPYWNSTVDTSPSDPLWDNAFLGQFDGAWGLNRALGSATLPTPQQLQDALTNFTTYDVFWPNLESVIHIPPHNWVKAKCLASPLRTIRSSSCTTAGSTCCGRNGSSCSLPPRSFRVDQVLTSMIR